MLGSVIFGLLVTLLSYFITTFVDIGYGSAIAAGFPLPYFYFHVGGSPQCPLMFTTSFACPVTFHPEYALGDFLLWSCISFVIVRTFRRPQALLVALGLAVGFLATLLTVLIRPISLVPVSPSSEYSGPFVLMGYPWFYFIDWQDFVLMSAAADFVFWAGLSLAVVGCAHALITRREPQPHGS